MLHKEKGKIAMKMKRTRWTQDQRAQKEWNIENRDIRGKKNKKNFI